MQIQNSIFMLALLIGTFRASFDKVLRWMIQDLTDDKSTLVQVMAWCRQATSHYLSQCWPRFLPPYGVTRPQCVNNNVIAPWYYPQNKQSGKMDHPKNKTQICSNWGLFWPVFEQCKNTAPTRAEPAVVSVDGVHNWTRNLVVPPTPSKEAIGSK